jgi:hypothetical protein
MVVNTVDWLVTSFMTSMMTILTIEARPANPDQPILRGLKKSARSYLLTYLRLMFWLKGWSIRKILLQARHRKSACQAGCISGTPCSLVSCSQVRCTHQNHFSRPATAFTSFSALILLNHDEQGLGLHE